MDNTTSSILSLALLLAFLYYLYRTYSLQKRLNKIAYVDEITGGDNYASLKHRLGMRITYRSGSIVLMSILNYSLIQSVCGNITANILLKKTNDTLKSMVVYPGLTSHLEAGRFVLYLPEQQEEELIKTVTEMRKRINTVVDELNIPPADACFGIAVLKEKDNIDEVMGKAKIALKDISHKPEQVYAFYGDAYLQKFLENSEFEQNFEEYIAQKSFEVWYQPKFDPFNGHIVGAEALIRLRGADGRLIPPYKFIPLFESDGLIRSLDRYVFQTVCTMQKERQDADQVVIPVSINLSRISLYYPHVVEEYAQIAQSIGVDTRYIPLEITESATVNVKDICSLLDDFCLKGFKLHMDDFGSGYSSLSALNILPFSTIKIDKSLTDFIGEMSGNALLRHLVALAKALGMHVTVEGVETKDQVDFLKYLGCHSIQGYYFSKPLPYTEFSQLLATTNITDMYRNSKINKEEEN